MELIIKHQDKYSRGQLLLRTFFGFFYIMIPHGFMLFFMSIAGAVLGFISWWAILFTGKYPKSFFDFQVGLTRWSIRVMATMYNLCDDYPAFGVKTETDNVVLDVPYPESLSRGKLLLKTFFGFIYVMIPHYFVLFFVMMLVGIINFIGWWAILITGQYPSSLHSIVVGFIRWSTRVGIYFNLVDTYPPFSLK